MMRRADKMNTTPESRGLLGSAREDSQSDARGGQSPRYVWPCVAALAVYLVGLACGPLPRATWSLPVVLTGGLIAAAVCMQWLLWYVRSTGRAAKARQVLLVHTWLGSVMPLLLLLHTSKLGRGSLLALNIVFITNLVVGLVNPSVVRPQARSLRKLWFVAHIALSLATIPLLAIHAWTRLRYRFE